MEYITLGRTGQTVSRMGLGGGGRSRLGHTAELSTPERVAIVRRALELGITYVDTARSYGTEEIVGQALQEARADGVFVSTKVSSYVRDERVMTPDELALEIEGCLRRLRRDVIDLFNFHGCIPSQYEPTRDTLVPELIRQREKGNIRFLGITERFNADPEHVMLSAAAADDCWDVFMVGFNILNQSARDRVLSHTRAKAIATQAMFVVRNAFRDPKSLAEVLSKLIDDGLVDRADMDLSDPLGFLMTEGGATSLVDASYRFCRDEPGLDVILSGTGSIEHLEANVESMARPPLPDAVRDRLKRIFARVDNVTGQAGQYRM